jgi:hypothetical protein
MNKWAEDTNGAVVKRLEDSSVELEDRTVAERNWVCLIHLQLIESRLMRNTLCFPFIDTNDMYLYNFVIFAVLPPLLS